MRGLKARVQDGGGGLIGAPGDMPRSQPFRIPAHIQDAVEEWARGTGRHAEIEWVPPPVGCFSVKIELRPSDPRMKAWQEGDLEEKPHEHVRLHVWKEGVRTHPKTGQPMGGYVPIDIRELGARGLVTHLERGDTRSGRGEFDSIEEATQHSLRQWKKQKEKKRKRAKQRAVDMGMSVRRQIMDIPFNRVGIELDSSGQEQSVAEAATES